MKNFNFFINFARTSLTVLIIHSLFYLTNTDKESEGSCVLNQEKKCQGKNINDINEIKALHKMIYSARIKPIHFGEYLSKEEFKERVPQNKDINFNDAYPLRIGSPTLISLREKRILNMTPHYFQKLNIGNFNHFYRICYENKFPVFFSTDSLLQLLISNVHDIIDRVKKYGIYHVYKKFIERTLLEIYNIREGLCTTPTDSSCLLKKKLNRVELLFIVGLNLFYNSCDIREIEPSKDIEDDFKRLRIKIRNGVDGYYTILGSEKFLRLSVFKLYQGEAHMDDCVQGMDLSLLWFEMNKLDLDDDLEVHYIWIIAKLIEESGVGAYYKSIYDFYAYLHGSLNTLGDYQHIYDVIFENTGLSDYDLDYLQIDEIRNLILDNSPKKQASNFFYTNVNHYGMSNLKRQRNIEKEYFRSVSFFEYNNKQSDLLNLAVHYLTNNDDKNEEVKSREMVSSAELLYAVTGSKGYKDLIDKRMKLDYNEKDFTIYRDRINYNNTLNKLSETYENMYNNNSTVVKSVLDHHFYYLLFSMNNETNKDIEDLENENIKNKKIFDPLYTSESYQHKEFQTTLGAIISYKREWKAQERKPNDYLVPGFIPDIYVEMKKNFYKDIREFVDILVFNLDTTYNNIKAATKGSVNYDIIANHTIIFQLDFHNMINYLEESVYYQENKMRKPYDFAHKLSHMIIASPSRFTWWGWYSKFFKPFWDDVGKMFKSTTYVSKIKTSYPKESLKYRGSLFYTLWKHYRYGLILVQDEGRDKILAFSRYETEDIYKPFDNELTLDDITANLSLNSNKKT